MKVFNKAYALAHEYSILARGQLTQSANFALGEFGDLGQQMIFAMHYRELETVTKQNFFLLQYLVEMRKCATSIEQDAYSTSDDYKQKIEYLKQRVETLYVLLADLTRHVKGEGSSHSNDAIDYMQKQQEAYNKELEQLRHYLDYFVDVQLVNEQIVKENQELNRYIEDLLKNTAAGEGRSVSIEWLNQMRAHDEQTISCLEEELRYMQALCYHYEFERPQSEVKHKNQLAYKQQEVQALQDQVDYLRASLDLHWGNMGADETQLLQTIQDLRGQIEELVVELNKAKQKADDYYHEHLFVYKLKYKCQDENNQSKLNMIEKCVEETQRYLVVSEKCVLKLKEVNAGGRTALDTIQQYLAEIEELKRTVEELNALKVRCEQSEAASKEASQLSLSGTFPAGIKQLMAAAVEKQKKISDMQSSKYTLLKSLDTQ